MNKKIIIAGSVFGLLGIIFGAFGAHGLKPYLTTEQLQTFEVGVRYQMYHALFLIFLGVFNGLHYKAKKNIALFVVIGILFFSGSIYFIATSNITTINTKKIGFITPLGGLFLILAWGALIYNVLKTRFDN